MLWKRMISKVSSVKDPLAQTHGSYHITGFFLTCFNDHKLHNLYLAEVSSTSHGKKKTNAKSEQEKHV